MFKVNNKDTITTTLAYFTHYSYVRIVDFEQVNAGWDVPLFLMLSTTM